MGYNYDIATSKKDGHANRGLGFCHTLAKAVDIFVSTFLIAHLYSFSTSAFDYCFKASLFEVIGYAVMLVVYFLASFLVAKTNRIWVYRLSLVMRAGVVLFSIFFGEQIARYIWLAGLLEGFSKGFYWASYNVLKQEMVSRKSINKFAVFTYILRQSVNVIFPITVGALIEVSTFSQVAIYVFIICLLQIAVSFVVHAKKPENSDFNIPDYWERLKANFPLYIKVKRAYNFSFIHGMTSVLSTLISVCVMLECGSNLSLGAITSVIAVAVILFILSFNRFTKEGKRNWLYILISLLPVVGSVIFIVNPNIVTVIIFNFCTEICSALFKVQYDVFRNKDLKEAGLYQDIGEHQGIIEITLCFSRVLTFGLVCLLSFSNSQILFNIMLIVFSIVYSINMLGILIYERARIKDEEQNKNTN